MDQVFVVTYPEPLPIEVEQIEHDAAPEGTVALAYYFRGNIIARGVVTEEGMELVRNLLENPVPVALAVTEDDEKNIEARVCLLLPLDSEHLTQEDEEDAPWKSSIPTPPPEVEASYTGGPEDEERPKLALFPIGSVIRNADNRNHPDDVVEDAQEMLQNLLMGRAQDAVDKAIDDLLKGL